MAGAVLAVPAIGLTMIYAVLRFVNFSVAAHMAVGAFAGYMLNAWLGWPAVARDRSAPSSAPARSASRAITSRCGRCAARARSRSRSRRSP